MPSELTWAGMSTKWRHKDSDTLFGPFRIHDLHISVPKAPFYSFSTMWDANNKVILRQDRIRAQNVIPVAGLLDALNTGCVSAEIENTVYVCNN